MTSLERWYEVCRKSQVEGYAAMSREERHWLNIRGLIDSIENGGLISYFYNSYSDTLPDCLRALDELGARDVRKQVELVCALFPGGVPGGGEERNEVIRSWADGGPVNALLDEVDERLMPMMPQLEEKLERFLRGSGLL